VLASDVVFMDETHWRLMDTDGVTAVTWCVASDDAAAYWIRIIVRRCRHRGPGTYTGCDVGRLRVYEALAACAGDSPVHCWRMCEKVHRGESSFPEECRQAITWIAISTPWRSGPQLHGRPG